jgi:hypothetical protein
MPATAVGLLAGRETDRKHAANNQPSLTAIVAAVTHTDTREDGLLRVEQMLHVPGEAGQIEFDSTTMINGVNPVLYTQIKIEVRERFDGNQT